MLSKKTVSSTTTLCNEDINDNVNAFIATRFKIFSSNSQMRKIPMKASKKLETTNPVYYPMPSLQMNLLITVWLAALLLQTQGHCAATANEAMNEMATNIVDTVFASWVRKTALAFGGGWGMFQSIAGGTFKPLLIWGGLGLVVNFIPKMIAWF